MGMWDEYCLVCGGPHQVFHVEDVIRDEIEFAKEEDRKPSPVSKIKKAYVKTSWLSRNIGVSSEDLIFDLGRYDDYGSFEMKDGRHFHGATNFRYGNVPDGDMYGLTMHKSCFNLIETKLKYQITFADIWPILLSQEYGNYFSNSTYGGMSKYHSQFFEVAKLIADGNEYLIQDPTHNSKNSSRILNLWRPLVRKIIKK